MPAFKPKCSKTICISAKKSTTLDSKHKAIICDIAKAEEVTLPELRTRRKAVKKSLNAKNNSIELIMELSDELVDINLKIKNIKISKKNYYLDNSRYVFDYYENKKHTANGNGNGATKILNSFFNIGVTKLDISKNEISDVQKYLCNVDDTFLDINNFVVQTDICQKCNEGELIPIEHEGMLVCNKCSTTLQYLLENEKPSYKELPNEVCFYAYKRINHFREILAQFQAKETTQIPNDVFENIKLQIKKERITPTQLTNRRAKEMLKKLGYNKYYEHIPFIKDKLGVKPPVMMPELEERLCSLFMDIQAPYAKYCPDDRVNFLNYYYTVYKLCELLEQNEFLHFFPMLKDREKRIEQDEIWKKICEELDWEFIPTV